MYCICVCIVKLWMKKFDYCFSYYVQIYLRVTSNTLRCIDKAGGLDNYVLNTKDKDLNSDVALRLRERILEKRKEIEKSEVAQWVCSFLLFP